MPPESMQTRRIGMASVSALFIAWRSVTQDGWILSDIREDRMIELRDVSVSYRRDVTALARVSLSVAKGEFVFLVGPTGAGKSTLLRLLSREERPTEGQVFVAGKDLNHMRSREIP